MLLLAACSAPKKAKGPVAPDSPWTDGTTFLLPSPAAAELAALRDILAAPLPDQSLALELAERHEARARGELASARKRWLDAYCGSGMTQEQLEHSQRALASAAFYVGAARGRFERALAGRLERSAGAGQRGAGWKAGRALVRQLGQERADLVRTSWEKLLVQAARKPRDVCAKKAETAAELPKERLFGPYYLALFRFYTALPVALRQELLTSLHGPSASSGPSGR